VRGRIKGTSRSGLANYIPTSAIIPTIEGITVKAGTALPLFILALAVLYDVAGFINATLKLFLLLAASQR